MANIKGLQQDAIATIDVAKVLVDKVNAILELFNYSPSLSVNLATNPVGFLLQLLERAGVTYEEIRHFLTEFLVFTVPELEISVKAILLSNLKNMVSCSIDPRIPDKYRKKHVVSEEYNTDQRHGINIDVESIDMFDKLSVSPLSDEGTDMYFGLEGVSDVYKFARADDFDAFLWFVIHKGRFPNSSKIQNMNSLTDDLHGNGADKVLPSGGTLLMPIEAQYSSDNPSKILPGNTFTYNGTPHIISMCIDSVYDEMSNITHNTLVPISDDWNSVNWYIRRKDQLWKNLGGGWKAVANKNDEGKITGTTVVYKKSYNRDFSKERAICNIQFIDQASSDSPITGLVNNRLRFTILPKPLMHIPNIDEGEPPWRFKKMIFDADGSYNPNGKYTIVGNDSDSLTYDGVSIDPKSGKVTVQKDTVVPNLIECYPGLTVYEFNYDYVMGMKLFDPKVIATQLLDSLVNTRVGVNVRLDKKHQEATEEIKEIIKNIINVDDSIVSDCFYSFDNSKYERLLRKAEEKRAERQSFGNTTTQISSFKSVKEILNEFDSNASLNEQFEILDRTITEASVILSEGSDAKDAYSIHFGFVCDLIENLTMAIVYSIFSPKVLMLLQVNEVIMGGKWRAFTTKDLLKALESVIISVINEIRDLILQELLKLLNKVLSPLITMFTAMVINEQVEGYVSAIRSMMEDCPILWFRFGNEYENTKLDTVDYADIDTSQIMPGEKPEKKC